MSPISPRSLRRREPDQTAQGPELHSASAARHARRAVIAHVAFDALAAERNISAGEPELVAFGVPFLANPDFIKRVRRGALMNTPDMAMSFTPGVKGYTDYPALVID